MPRTIDELNERQPCFWSRSRTVVAVDRVEAVEEDAVGDHAADHRGPEVQQDPDAADIVILQRVLHAAMEPVHEGVEQPEDRVVLVSAVLVRVGRHVLRKGTREMEVGRRAAGVSRPSSALTQPTTSIRTRSTRPAMCRC